MFFYPFRYSIEKDPAGWVTVNPTTGEIFVKKSFDRESSHVTNGTYTITVLVKEKGNLLVYHVTQISTEFLQKSFQLFRNVQYICVSSVIPDNPKMTSTATIQIYVEDKNDNVPLLKESVVSVCQSDEISSTEITACDPDGDPYSGPFSFELIGDVKEEWHFDPSNGKEKNVFSLYKILFTNSVNSFMQEETKCLISFALSVRQHCAFGETQKRLSWSVHADGENLR